MTSGLDWENSIKFHIIKKNPNDCNDAVNPDFSDETENSSLTLDFNLGKRLKKDEIHSKESQLNNTDDIADSMISLLELNKESSESSDIDSDDLYLVCSNKSTKSTLSSELKEVHTNGGSGMTFSLLI